METLYWVWTLFCSAGWTSTEYEPLATVTDTYPLPVEGTETTVIADDNLNALMASLGDSLELVCPLKL